MRELLGPPRRFGSDPIDILALVLAALMLAGIVAVAVVTLMFDGEGWRTVVDPDTGQTFRCSTNRDYCYETTEGNQ